jgi:hypothetical protein
MPDSRLPEDLAKAFRKHPKRLVGTFWCTNSALFRIVAYSKGVLTTLKMPDSDLGKTDPVTLINSYIYLGRAYQCSGFMLEKASGIFIEILGPWEGYMQIRRVYGDFSKVPHISPIDALRYVDFPTLVDKYRPVGAVENTVCCDSRRSMEALLREAFTNRQSEIRRIKDSSWVEPAAVIPEPAPEPEEPVRLSAWERLK